VNWPRKKTTAVKRETNNKSLHLKRSWFQKKILKNVSGSKHKKITTSTFVSTSTAKLNVLIKKECTERTAQWPEDFSHELRYKALI